jgi:hypothetical protein
MQQLREIPNRADDAIHHRSHFSQRLRICACGAGAALENGDSDPDGRQRLADFIVEIPGDGSPLLLLNMDESGGQPLQVALVLSLLKVLEPNQCFQASGVAGGDERNPETERNSYAARPPHTLAHDGV